MEEAAKYVAERKPRSEPGLNQVHDLLDYLQDTYPDDDTLRILEWRAVTASANRTVPIGAAETGLLRAERARVDKWALYLEGETDPEVEAVRSLWRGLDACFNPHTGDLDEWFYGDEANVLKELTGRYGSAPEGEPPAIFN
jgi:hypothetical protein